MGNPYLVLGVSRDAPDYVVQAAFRACLKRFHPDQYRGADASSKTAEIVAAYGILRDLDKRRALDERLTRSDASNKKTPPPPPAPPPKSSPCPDLELEPPKKSNWQTLGGIGTAGVILYALFYSAQRDNPEVFAYDAVTSEATADTVEIPQTRSCSLRKKQQMLRRMQLA